MMRKFHNEIFYCLTDRPSSVTGNLRVRYHTISAYEHVTGIGTSFIPTSPHDEFPLRRRKETNFLSYFILLPYLFH